MTDKPVWPRVRFAAAEFIVIVAGVLVALAVDEWRQSRQDRDLELQYASRLRLDLQRDTSRFGDFERNALAAKADVLMGLRQRASHPATGSAATRVPSPTMQELFFSQFIALPEAQSAVFREMESTGTVRLLRDPGLRTELSNHYALHELLAGILEQPIGPYREIFAAALPGEMQYRWTAESLEPDSAALAQAIGALVAHPEFLDAVNAELGYTGAMVYWLRQSRDRAEAILARLDQVYPSPQ